MDELFPNILHWALDPALIRERMVLLAGPRQIGKTTLLQHYLQTVGHPEWYFNWDRIQTRTAYRHNPDFFATQLPAATTTAPIPVVFDELHKFPKWKSHLKGLYDTWKGRVRFIVTGSARLDIMRRSGDSLVGRYYLFRRCPLHPRECLSQADPLPSWSPGQPWNPPPPSASGWLEAIQQLMRINGFPEPFLAGSEAVLNRWQMEHLTLLITEDLADLTKIEQILRVEELAGLLRHRVGSPLSTNSLANDLSAGFPTVKRWLDALELVYLTFRIPPYTRRLTRANRKEPKLYFWDWSLVMDPAARFENIVAVYLMRAVHAWNEQGLGQFNLHYVRTRDQIEVDFLITDRQRPILLVEVKQTAHDIASPLLRVKGWLDVPLAWQIVETANALHAHRDPHVWIIGIDRLLHSLP